MDVLGQRPAGAAAGLAVTRTGKPTLTCVLCLVPSLARMSSSPMSSQKPPSTFHSNLASTGVSLVLPKLRMLSLGARATQDGLPTLAVFEH